jgi:hypothetical protein
VAAGMAEIYFESVGISWDTKEAGVILQQNRRSKGAAAAKEFFFNLAAALSSTYSFGYEKELLLEISLWLAKDLCQLQLSDSSSKLSFFLCENIRHILCCFRSFYSCKYGQVVLQFQQN